MAFTIVARGSSTLPVSNDDYSEVTVSAAAASVGDIVLITATSALPMDLKHYHSMYVSEVTTDGFTVASSFKDLPVAVTFDYVIIHEA